MHDDFDILILGGGQGGSLARMLAEGGKRVALIEKAQFGGTCTNHGCTPTKALISSAKRAYDARTASPLGVDASSVSIDWSEITQRTRSIASRFRVEIEERLSSLPNLHIVRGTGHFTAPQTLEVQENNGTKHTLRAPKIVIATGARPFVPPIEGLDEVEYLDYTTILKLPALPSHLVILGGGYIACEFGQALARLGCPVTLIQKGEQLLGQEDKDVAAEVADVLRESGVQLRFESNCVQVARTENGGIEFRCQDGQTERASHLFLAVGQKPNTQGLGLEKLGVTLGKEGEIVVDDTLQAAPGVWALGDCKGVPAFTHVAYNDARLLAQHFLQGTPISIAGRVVPYVVFTDPQLGRIGETEKSATAKGLKFRVACLPVCDTARGVETGEDAGFLKILVGNDDLILGAALLARDGGELLGTVQTAMLARLPYQVLQEAIWAHPTQTEALNRLFKELSKSPKP